MTIRELFEQGTRVSINVSGVDLGEIAEWSQEHLEGDWNIACDGRPSMFEYEKDAIMFALRWGGERDQ